MSAPTRPTEIRALAGARALPPLLLVLYHYSEGHGYQNAPWFDVFVAKGYLWVEFFFALSGFVLIHVYGPRVAELWRARGYGDFLKARLARLYPLHLATLLIILGMVVGLRALAQAGHYVSIFDDPDYHPYVDWTSFAANLFLVQAWHLFRHLTWNGVAWFVSVEFFLCLIFPLFAWISRGGALIAGALIAIGFGVLYVLAITSKHGLDITYDWGIVRGIGDFSIGVGMAMLYRAAMARGAGAISGFVLSAAQLIAFFLFFYSMYHTGWSHQWRDFLVLPGMMLTIFTLSFDRGIVARIFQAKILRGLGEWSFAIYMGQTVWLQMLRFFEQRFYPDPAPAWVHPIHLIEPVCLVIVCAAWGWLLFALVERPANGFLRAAFARPKAA